MGFGGEELGVLPPGDVRQCLVALSEHSDVVRKLMNYRFNEGGLAGHNFGNIFLAALEKVTGDFARGVEVVSEILKVKGAVVPITKDKAELAVMLKNGKVIDGQVNITDTNLVDLGLKKIFYKNKVRLNENARVEILKADYIIIGPGNYYSSIIPNLIVDGFQKAISQSRAKIILPVNLTNKKEHTKNWQVGDYVKDFEKYLKKPVDFILVNTEPLSQKQIKSYKLKEGEGVLVKNNLERDSRLILKPLLSALIVNFDKTDKRRKHRSFIRHDSEKLAESVKKIMEK